MIGLRTENYKYFRHARNSKENIHLYDLENDPEENNNISENENKLVLEMEELLGKIQSDSIYSDNDITDEEEEEISKELRKLGYL